MFSRVLPFLLVSAASASTVPRLLSASDPGMTMARRLQDQFDQLPDICSGFELIIDEIPDGRDSCECDGTRVNCLFRAVCPEGHKDEARCADTVLYEVAFEEDEVTVLSCAAIAEGGFKETCAKVSLAPDLQLDECMVGSYGGQPCDCDVCADRNSLLLDCTAYDPRAKADCQAMGLAQLTPVVHGFNTTAPPPPDQDSIDGEPESSTVNGLQSESGAIQKATTAVCFLLAFAVPFVSLL